MATNIVIPALGESISEAVISAWLKADGDYVNRDEDLVELETDKVTMPLPSPAAGVIRIAAKEGDTVEIGAVIGTIDETASKPAESAAPAATPAAAQAAPAKPAAAPAATSAPAPAPAPVPAAPEAAAGPVFSTPVAKRLAEEHGVQLGAIHGTGPGGRIREHDVLAYIQTHDGKNGSAAGAPPAGKAVANGSGTSGAFSRSTRLEKMSPLRQRIAVRLVEAQHNAAMLTTFNECDMTHVMALRSQHKDAFEKQHGVKLGFMSFFVKAVVSGLRKVPSVNAFIVDSESGPALQHHDYCDIAVAVGTPKGLVVPVLRNAESRDFAGIESGIGELAKKARDGKLTLDDMQGGTFTISNGGVYGSMMSTPILNPPQSGILGMHNIIRRPIENPAKPGSGEVVVRPMMYLALSYDHRIVDGEGAVTFLRHVKECIESPERLLLGV